jgi:hypothetical protein
VVVVTFYDKKRNAYSAKELDALEVFLDDYLLNSRNAESQAVESLERHLWLANGAGATAAVGFIQAAKAAKLAVSSWQFAGAWLFIAGIAVLVVLKFISEAQSSRMRFRFQHAAIEFEANRASDFVFCKLRDETFTFMHRIYLALRFTAGITFLGGLVVTLIGLRSAV